MLNAITRFGGFVTLTAFVLSACAVVRPDPYPCDSKVTAIEIGSRVELITPDTLQPVKIRLNGVSARCFPYEDEILFDVSVGLKISRDLADSSEVSKIQVPFIVAIIDEAETVTGHESFAYRMALSKRTENLFPVVDFKVKAPKNGRIILSLTPKTIDLDK